MLGARVDRFTLSEVLSVGAYTTVYLAKADDGDEIVVRVLHPSLEHDAHARGAVQREAWMGSKQFHPARVRTLFTGHLEGRHLYLAQEHVRGTPLDVLMLREGPLALDAAIRVVSTVLAVIEGCHARGLAHGPVDPSKVIAAHEGGYRVLHCDDSASDASTRAARDLASCGLLLASLVGGEPLAAPPEREWLETTIAGTHAEALVALRLHELFDRTLHGRPRPFVDAGELHAHLEATLELQLLEGAFLAEDWPAPAESGAPIRSEVVPRREDPAWSELLEPSRKAHGHG